MWSEQLLHGGHKNMRKSFLSILGLSGLFKKPKKAKDKLIQKSKNKSDNVKNIS